MQRAATALKNKQLKEDRAVVAQIVRESRAIDATTRKVPLKKPTPASNRSTKTSSLGTTTPKPSARSVPPKKPALKRVVTVVPPEKVVPEVVVTNRGGRRIKPPSRYD